MLMMLLLSPVWLSGSSLFAQLPNGTLITQEYFDMVLANINDEVLEIVDTISPELNVNLKLEVFVLTDAQGGINFENDWLVSSLNIANSFFRKIGLSFSIGNITIVPEYDYSVLNNEIEVAELEAKYCIQRRLNLFLVDGIEMNGNQSYGYTTYPSDTIHNNIFIRKDYLIGNNLTALFGSYFGLLNTYESFGELELVDGSNCLSAGDVICDTYADPGGLYASTNYKCQYIGTITDPNGEFYLPSVANIMSDSPDECKCVFTPGQYRRMKYYFKKYKTYLQ